MKIIMILFSLLVLIASCTKSHDFLENSGNNDSRNLKVAIVTYPITIEVRSANGAILSGIYIYIDDGKSCLFATTNLAGRAVINVQNKRCVLIAYDTLKRKLYGVFGTTYLSIPTLTKIALPAIPTTPTTAGAMWDQFALGINYGSTLNSLWSLYNNHAGYTLGVPGVFGISPMPTVDSQGRLYFTLSGILVKEVEAFVIIATGKVNSYKMI